MKQIIQGTRVIPVRVDVKIGVNWINGVDLSAMPTESLGVISDIREVVPMKKTRVYNSVTDFIDGTQVISRAIVPLADDPEFNFTRTWGKIDSPISFILYDTSPF